jgi:hypothetical protein
VLIKTYAVIAYLLALQPFLTVLCSQNALIAAQCVSPVLSDSFKNLKINLFHLTERIIVNKQKILTELQRAYVAIMMEVVGRGLVSTSFVDEEVQKEISGLPVGFHFQMIVLPNGSSFTAKVIAGGHLELVPDFTG